MVINGVLKEQASAMSRKGKGRSKRRRLGKSAEVCIPAKAGSCTRCNGIQGKRGLGGERVPSQRTIWLKRTGPSRLGRKLKKPGNDAKSRQNEKILGPVPAEFVVFAAVKDRRGFSNSNRALFRDRLGMPGKD